MVQQEAEKKRKEEEEKKKKKVPDTPAVKYGKNLCKYAWRGNKKRCERCIRKGASVEYAHPISLSRPLHRACLGGSMEVVRYLVDDLKCTLNPVDDEEWTPMHFAASKGHAEIIFFLSQKKGISLDSKDSGGNTPLHLAAARGHVNVVEVLLQQGASTREKNARGELASDVASTRKLARMIAGLARDEKEEQDEDVVTGQLKSEVQQQQQQQQQVKEGEFFDATHMYGLQFSSEEEESTKEVE